MSSPGATPIGAQIITVLNALINLLHNAVDAVREVTDPCISVRCARLVDGRIVISVADNGGGIDPVTVDKIFLPFFTTKAGGSGIGLSLTRNITTAHGGSVELSDNPPRGAKVTLILPN
jgi:signal transduction histidine kinase